ncbi:hypothetical protein [Streptomyces sp. SAI-127]|uniref:hypothetical protein n=1 Tax=Streptomyces sp. SAI-127 TaxID=2940543 RepID=UPI002473E4D5|nr:hypothetical protein [Streptomyces sp. SAI-127]MDH6493725.1 hypothetical protein [Streptomyces sp. SAI-127]
MPVWGEGLAWSVLSVDYQRILRLGTFIDNARRRADKLSEERRAELAELGMRW